MTRLPSEVLVETRLTLPAVPEYLHRRYPEVAMKTRVQKWGNSLALRIPKSFAVEAGLCADAAVELSLADGALVVRPITPQPLTLEELLRGITDENLHGEWDTGPAVGKEVW
jgi:antitoxin MazE